MAAILDTTLREGERSPGVYFSPGQKLELAAALAEAGVDIIEVGNPDTHPAIAAAIKAIAAAGLRAEVAAFTCCEIPSVTKVLACGVGHCGVHISASDERLARDFAMTRAQALDRVETVIGYVKADRPEVTLRLVVEDAARSPLDQVLELCVAGAQAGADIIGITDAGGYLVPTPGPRHIGSLVGAIVSGLAERGLSPRIAVQLNNDRGLALANALIACEAGADIVNASVLGLGERAGIVDLLPLASALSESDPECDGRYRLDRLLEVYDRVARYSRRDIPGTLPIAGHYAFTHYSGVHVRAVRAEPSLYMSLDPKRFGTDWSLALGVQSGRHSIELALEIIGREDLIEESKGEGDWDLIDSILREVKWAASRGETVEVMKEFLSIVWRCEREWRVLQASGETVPASREEAVPNTADAGAAGAGETPPELE